MKTIRIVTHSDDTIDIDGLVEGDGMDTNARGGVYGTIEIMDRAHSRGVTIECHYNTELCERTDAGVWIALVRRPDEGVGLLPVRINAPNVSAGYNIEIEVDAPAGAEVTYYLSCEGDDEEKHTTTVA